MRRLLLDQNLSPKLVSRLADVYPDSVHVSTVGLGSADDRTVWEFARQHDYIIATKDVDFGEWLLVYGFPPKILWIRRGNCSTDDVERLLRENLEAVETMAEDPDIGILTLY